MDRSPSTFPRFDPFSSLGIEKIHRCCFEEETAESGLVREKVRVSAQLMDGEIRCCPGEEQGESVCPFEKGGVFPSGGWGIKARERSKWNRRSDTHNASMQRLSSFSILPLKVSRLSRKRRKLFIVVASCIFHGEKEGNYSSST